jgi:hypothetical protein
MTLAVCSSLQHIFTFAWKTDFDEAHHERRLVTQLRSQERSPDDGVGPGLR